MGESLTEHECGCLPLCSSSVTLHILLRRFRGCSSTQLMRNKLIENIHMLICICASVCNFLNVCNDNPSKLYAIAGRSLSWSKNMFMRLYCSEP